MKEYLEIGKIVNTFGIKGEVKAEVWCDSPEFFCNFKILYKDENGNEKITVTSRPHKNTALVKIKGFDTLAQAESLKGTVFFAKRSDIELPEGTFFIQDIIGCEVKNFDTKESYGKVKDVLKTGANDVYLLENGNMVPVIDIIVKEKNIQNGEILIIPIEGLFE